jgi:oligo-1,6-glucosidase
MQWDTTRNAGFTNGNPWLPVNKNYRQINVTVQNQDPNSVLNHFRRMTKLRRENPVLVYGAYTLVEKDHPTIYAYTRELDGEKMLIALNFSDGQQVLNTSLVNEMHELVINNYPSLDISNGSMKLEPYQAIILRIKSS